jgi:hypothetical protein
MAYPYARLSVAPLFCDVCNRPVVDESLATVLFFWRPRKDRPPEKFIIVHKRTCDTNPGCSGYVIRSMELSELRRLCHEPIPSPTTERVPAMA